MKIAVFSDLHLEFRPQTTDLMTLVRKIEEAAEQVDLVINAGDTHPDAAIRTQLRKRLSKHTYIDVLGNHDYYGGKWITDNYQMHVKDGLRIFAGTLWTCFANNPLVEHFAERQIYDFRQIKGVSTKAVYEEYLKEVEYIELMKPDIVVTHFAPHPLSIHPRYRSEVLNPYFVNNLDATIQMVQPKLWIHGHVHDPFDYTVHDTRVVCNPLGYPRERYGSIDDYQVKIVEL